MKMQRKVVQSAPGMGVRAQAASAGGGVEPIGMGGNMMAQQELAQADVEQTRGIFDGWFGGSEAKAETTPETTPETPAEKRKRERKERNQAARNENRKSDLKHDECIVTGAEDYRYTGGYKEKGQAEIITSSAAGGDTLDAFSSSRKFLADRDQYGSDRTSWKNAVTNDANAGGTYGLMGTSDYETEGMKLAVLVGNDGYANIDGLNGAKQDAAARGSYYDSLGFITTNFEDASASAMSTYFANGAAVARPGDHVVLYYAGHGSTQGALGVDFSYRDPGSVMPWSLMVGIANKAVSAGFKATIVMDACESDQLQADAATEHIDVNQHSVLIDEMKMNAQSEAGDDDWERLEEQLKSMDATINFTADDYKFLMERRHALRDYDTGLPKVGVKA